MFSWLKKIWNKNWYAREDGYKFASRSRAERRAVKEDTRYSLTSWMCYCQFAELNGNIIKVTHPECPQHGD